MTAKELLNRYELDLQKEKQIESYISSQKESINSLDLIPSRLNRQMKDRLLKLNNKLHTYEEDLILFMISNTSSVGGFRTLISNAEITDGKLDLFAIRKMDPLEVVPLLGSFVVGDQINSDKILYIQSDEIVIESDESIVLDIDGEQGSSLPARINCIKEAITLIVPGKEEPL